MTAITLKGDASEASTRTGPPNAAWGTICRRKQDVAFADAIVEADTY